MSKFPIIPGTEALYHSCLFVHSVAKVVSPLRVVSLSFKPFAKKVFNLFCQYSENSILSLCGLVWIVTLFLDALCYILQLYKRFLDTTLLLQLHQKRLIQRIISIIKIAPCLPPSTRETTYGTCMRASRKLTLTFGWLGLLAVVKEYEKASPQPSK